ncbi:hypothetical protein [Methanosarcina sp. KYL-1]|uniref:hypothetical protein n=1 Tax=Methanosarcina sp. KYL-1 TaxID=2602068 RepID=UPI0021008D21|nr:hypothetical protein [Methanosarcina sp. KYL-1]
MTKLSGAFERRTAARSEGLSFSGSYKGLVPELRAILAAADRFTKRLVKSKGSGA